MRKTHIIVKIADGDLVVREWEHVTDNPADELVPLKQRIQHEFNTTPCIHDLDATTEGGSDDNR